MTRFRSIRNFSLARFVLILAITFALAPNVCAQERAFPLVLKRAPIAKLIKRVAEETQRPILFDDQVRGNISVVTQRPVTEGEAWSILESSLSMLGFSLLPSSADHWRISKVADAVGEAPFVATVGTTKESFVTTLFTLRSANLQAVMNVLEPISGARVTLVPYEVSNSLIASGPERAIARLISISNELDRVDQFELHTRVLRYRDVADVESILEMWLSSGQRDDAVKHLQTWSDQRTNSILFRGSDVEVARLGGFLDQIDQPIEGGGRIRILRVLNREPEDVAALIRELAQGGESSGNGAAARGADLSGAEFVLAVDQATRSLVVKADSATQIEIRDLLEMLDVPPQLISVDITISEIRSPKSISLAFAFSVPLNATAGVNDLATRLVSTPVAGALFATPNDQSTVFGRVARDTGVSFDIPGDPNPITIPIEDTGVISGGQFTIRNEVLIQPHLILTAGEYHEVFVGNNVPVPVTEGAPGDIDPTNVTGIRLARTIRFDRTDIGIRLGLEAKAGRVGKIQLDIDLDVSSLVPSLAGPIEQVGPTFLEETLNLRALLEDGEAAVIAMYRNREELKGQSGVPWLSDIPILGWLFSGTADTKQDTRLVVAARARRISSPSQLVAESIRRRLAFQRHNARDGTLPNADGPPFGVRVTTRSRSDDAEAIAEGLRLRGYTTSIQSWSVEGDELFDVYVVSLESMADAAEIAAILSRDGWEPDLVVLPNRS